MIILKNPDDETKLYWFLRKVMYCVHINHDHNSTQTYKDAVTESDEAFAFMVLALYGKKWKAGVTTRVSGDEKDGTIAFYAEKHRAISQIRENEKNKPFYIEVDEWMKARDALKSTSGGAGNGPLRKKVTRDQANELDELNLEILSKLRPHDSYHISTVGVDSFGV